MTEPLVLEHVTVKRDRLVLDVCMPLPYLRYTTPQVARRACAARPALARHACVNIHGSTFGAIIHHTSLAHLLEHLIIDVQTERSDREDAVFVGTTTWMNEGQGRARIEVSFVSDLDAFAALREALALLADIVAG